MKNKTRLFTILIVISTFSCQLGGETSSQVICSVEHPEGVCPLGQYCEEGQCLTEAQPCSVTNPDGYCVGDQICDEGLCQSPCSSSNPEGWCSGEQLCREGACRDICSPLYPQGYCEPGYVCDLGNCIQGEPCSFEYPDGYCPGSQICEEGTCVENNLDLGDFQTFNGTFAQLYHFESTTRVYGIDTFSVTETILLLQQVQNGSQVQVTATVCDIDITNGQGGFGPVQIVVPNNYIAHLNPTDITLSLSQDGSEVLITHPDLIEVRGAQFDDPANDPMVEDKTDPRIIDQDEDGNPGMTLVATGVVSGEIYSVQRTTTRVIGSITSADTYDGDVIWSDEQVVVDAENEALIQNMDASPHLDESYFFTTRIGSGQDCQYIIDNAQSLFAR